MVSKRNIISVFKTLSPEEQIYMLYQAPFHIKSWFQGYAMEPSKGQVESRIQKYIKVMNLFKKLSGSEMRSQKLFRLVSIPKEDSCEDYSKYKKVRFRTANKPIQSWTTDFNSALEFYNVYRNIGARGYKQSKNWAFLIVEATIPGKNMLVTLGNVLPVLQVLKDDIFPVYAPRLFPEESKRQLKLNSLAFNYAIKELNTKFLREQKEVIVYLPTQETVIDKIHVVKCEDEAKQKERSLQKKNS